MGEGPRSLPTYLVKDLSDFPQKKIGWGTWGSEIFQSIPLPTPLPDPRKIPLIRYGVNVECIIIVYEERPKLSVGIRDRVRIRKLGRT